MVQTCGAKVGGSTADWGRRGNVKAPLGSLDQIGARERFFDKLVHKVLELTFARAITLDELHTGSFQVAVLGFAVGVVPGDSTVDL